MTQDSSHDFAAVPPTWGLGINRTEVLVDSSDRHSYTKLRYYDTVQLGVTMMKASVKRAIREEKGNVLILVLVLLVVGGLILAPLLGLMSTGLVAGQVYEKKTAELYAADAGIEDAINWLMPPDPQDPEGPWEWDEEQQVWNRSTPIRVNDKDVWVTIDTTDTGAFLADMLDYNSTNEPHSDWMVTYRSPAPGTFSISITWNGTAENKRISSVGAWLGGAYSYVEGQDIGDGDIRETYPNYTFDPQGFSFGGGMAFIWEWPSNPDRPTFNPGDTMTLTFQFMPGNTPPAGIGWAMAGSQDVGLTYDADFALHTITATATSDTGTQTVIVAHAVTRGCQGDEITILSWNIG